MIEIIREPATTSTPNPFAFDPETGAGGWAVWPGPKRQVRRVHISLVYSPDGSYGFPSDCYNIHQTPDGGWALGRDPALVRKAEPRVFTLAEVEMLAEPGDVFRTVDPEGGETEWFIRSNEGWIGKETKNVWCSDDLQYLDERRLHYYGNHTLSLTLPAQPVAFREGE